MMRFWYFINSPGVFFIETAEKRLEEWDADAYAARELEINRALLEKAVAAGRVGTVCSHDDFFEDMCDKHEDWATVCEKTLEHILAL